MFLTQNRIILQKFEPIKNGVKGPFDPDSSKYPTHAAPLSEENTTRVSPRIPFLSRAPTICPIDQYNSCIEFPIRPLFDL